MNRKEKKKWAAGIIRILKKEYPGEGTALNWNTPLELLVATILSAQSTDKQINKITVDLFKKYRTARDYARADRKEFEEDIRSSGFFRNKVKNIIAAARLIVEEYDGEVPDSMDDLLRLPGVARKTANIVLYNGFGVTAGIAVDTHVKRLSQRLGLSGNKNPDTIEKDLMAIVEEKHWGPVNYLFISHGRRICTARRPACPECVLLEECPRIGVEVLLK